MVKPLPGAQLDRSHPLAQGNQGLWLMNEGSGPSVYDYSGNDTHGTLSANASWAVGDGWAVQTAVDASITVPTTKLNTATGTIFLRWRRDVASDGSYYLWDSSGLRFLLFYHSPVGYYQLYTGGAIRGNFATARRDLVWQTACITWPTNDLYFDGAFVHTFADGNITGIGTTLYLGNRYTMSEGLPGRIDCASIYNRALSADEVAWLSAEPYCMFTRPDRWLRVFDFGAALKRIIYPWHTPGFNAGLTRL